MLKVNNKNTVWISKRNEVTNYNVQKLLSHFVVVHFLKLAMSL